MIIAVRVAKEWKMKYREPHWTAITSSMATLACVPDSPFLLVLVALDLRSACSPSNSGPSGPEPKIERWHPACYLPNPAPLEEAQKIEREKI